MLYAANAENFSTESREWAKKIIHSTDRMQMLVHDVLSLSTITDEIEFNIVNIKEVISAVLEDLEMNISEKKASIQVGEIPLVTGNKSYLTQLFSNLISNAIKFTKKIPVISIKGETIRTRVFIHITDNGIGIDKKDYSKIFEAFSRLNPKMEFEGSGIGLTICKKIASIHNGHIKVESEPGLWTTFTIDLPAAE